MWEYLVFTIEFINKVTIDKLHTINKLDIFNYLFLLNKHTKYHIIPLQ